MYSAFTFSKKSIKNLLKIFNEYDVYFYGILTENIFDSFLYIEEAKSNWLLKKYPFLIRQKKFDLPFSELEKFFNNLRLKYKEGDTVNLLGYNKLPFTITSITHEGYLLKSNLYGLHIEEFVPLIKPCFYKTDLAVDYGLKKSNLDIEYKVLVDMSCFDYHDIKAVLQGLFVVKDTFKQPILLFNVPLNSLDIFLGLGMVVLQGSIFSYIKGKKDVIVVTNDELLLPCECYNIAHITDKNRVIYDFLPEKLYSLTHVSNFYHTVRDLTKVDNIYTKPFRDKKYVLSFQTVTVSFIKKVYFKYYSKSPDVFFNYFLKRVLFDV